MNIIGPPERKSPEDETCFGNHANGMSGGREGWGREVEGGRGRGGEGREEDWYTIIGNDEKSHAEEAPRYRKGCFNATSRPAPQRLGLQGSMASSPSSMHEHKGSTPIPASPTAKSSKVSLRGLNNLYSKYQIQPIFDIKIPRTDAKSNKAPNKHNLNFSSSIGVHGVSGIASIRILKSRAVEAPRYREGCFSTTSMPSPQRLGLRGLMASRLQVLYT